MFFKRNVQNSDDSWRADNTTSAWTWHLRKFSPKSKAEADLMLCRGRQFKANADAAIWAHLEQRRLQKAWGLRIQLEITRRNGHAKMTHWRFCTAQLPPYQLHAIITWAFISVHSCKLTGSLYVWNSNKWREKISILIFNFNSWAA